MYLKIKIWKEEASSYSEYIEKICDTIWTNEKTKSLCYNYDILNKFRLKDINAVSVIKRKDGRFYINQICGYNTRKGLFGYLVNPDNTLSRFI